MVYHATISDLHSPGSNGGVRQASAPTTLRVAVVYASNYGETSPGGITIGVWRIILGLREGIRTLLVCVADSGEVSALRNRFGDRNITVLPVLPASRRARHVPLNIVFAIALIFKRRGILRESDVIHAHRMESALPFVVRKSKPVVLTVHGSSRDHSFCRTGMLRWRFIRRAYEIAEGFVFSRVDQITLVSREAFEYYTSRYSRLRAKFALIPPVLDPAAFDVVDRSIARAYFGLRDEDLAVVFVGRLSEQKRVDLVIAASARLVKERASTHLFIAGVGPEEGRLRLQAVKCGLKSVRFLGLLSPPEVRRLLCCADAVTLPSLWEGLPMVVLEALACGIPVVASNVGGIREVLTGELEEFILSSDDPEELKNTIVAAASRREAVRDLCVATARRYGASRILAQLEHIYDHLVHPTA